MKSNIYLASLLLAGSIPGLVSCTEIRENAYEKWQSFNIKSEKLDSMVNYKLDKVDQLDSMIDREMKKINTLDSIIKSKYSKLDSLLDNNQ